MKDIALVIGNGFSKSFNNYHELQKFSDTSNPLKWDIPNPDGEGLFLDVLYRLRKFIDDHPGEDDFSIFKKAAKIGPPGYADNFLPQDKHYVSLESRHYLSIAFSHYSKYVKKTIKADWPWYKWINHHKRRIGAISSYNYDLIIEIMLERLGIHYNEAAIPKQFGDVILHKPHGSCSYEINPHAIGGFRKGYPLRNYFYKTDTQFVKLSNRTMLEPRLDPLCIIPNEPNLYSGFDTMWQHELKFRHFLSKCSYCLFVGNSYMECDRPELDAMLSSLKKECIVIVSNPSPCELMLEKIKSFGLSPVTWVDYTGPVNKNGELILL